MNLSPDEIGSAACPECIVCGGPGEVIQRNLQDRLFGASGSWDLKKCSDRACGLIWPDPMPLAGEIGKAYANYYTHQAPDNPSQTGVAGILRRMERGYWASHYAYPTKRSLLITASGILLNLFPLRRRRTDERVRFLRATPGGRLLDVGCGSGDWLFFMRQLGWQVVGTDFDERAVELARQRGVEAHCGILEQQDFPTAGFDAVTLHHVIEHVPDPLGTLTECARLLKPGGKLVIATPNGASLSHRVFKQDWRGLEPPRHLHIFSPGSLQRVLQMAGFKKITIHPIIARSVVCESVLLRRGQGALIRGESRPRSARFLAALFNFMELGLVKFNPSVSDCICAVAVKE